MLLTRCTHGEKKHICEHCGKGFKDNQNLKNHVQYVHFKIKRFSCELCEKAGIEKSFTHFQGLKAQLYIRTVSSEIACFLFFHVIIDFISSFL